MVDYVAGILIAAIMVYAVISIIKRSKNAGACGGACPYCASGCHVDNGKEKVDEVTQKKSQRGN
jgi:hypothetical protein